MSQQRARPDKGDWLVLAFTISYVAAFAIWFFSRQNYEFIWYIATMAVLIALVGLNLQKAQFPTAMLWALTLWGLAHMAGGGVPVGDSVLYSKVLVLLTGEGEMTILKYDQVVHSYGFGVTAWLLWHLLSLNFPQMRHTRSIYVFPALAAMGLGAVNEIIEFIAVLVFPDTNVGGYYNTALDLVFNAAGAVIAMMLVALASRHNATDA
jgi:hypothetical protein